MKRKWFAALLIGVMVCMTACGTEKENPPVEEPNQVEKVSKEQPESTDEQLRRNAYADALLKLLQERIFPDGVQADYESNSKFAVYDIDGDGRNELLINYSGECMAGTVLKIYDYDIETRAFRAELSEFPGVIFYGNGIIEAGLSHNHGLASDSEDFWPYTLYEYHKESDMYQSVAFVDGWTKTWKEEYDGISFPDEIDADGDGMIYLIMEGEYNLQEAEMLDRKDYEAWRASYLKGASEAEIPAWEYLTEENIMALCAGE